MVKRYRNPSVPARGARPEPQPVSIRANTAVRGSTESSKRRVTMLFATVYRWRDDAHTKDAGAAIMQHYADLGGDAPGTIAHYVFADGTGGIVITDATDAERAYQTSLHFNEFLDLDLTDIKPVLKVEEAVPIINDYLGS
jgi:hypothetical protein